jgi:hypothetical protein
MKPGGIAVPNDKSYDLDEIIRFLKKGDYSIFDFYSEYTAEDAGIDTKGRGFLCICNVSDNLIPEETVIQVIDVLEHLDECIEQAYDLLTYHEFGVIGVSRFGKEKESIRDIIIKRYTVSEICFRWDDDFWPPSVINEYWRGPEPPKGADVFFIDFCHRDCDSGFRFMFLCEDRRLYKFIIHIR